MASTKKNDTILDPFFGTGTTGAVAKKLKRSFIGIERDELYADFAKDRIQSINPLKDNLIDSQAKREQPRIPFGSLTDSKKRHKVTVHADGSVIAQNRIDKTRGSIHKVGAALQDAPSCNGWTFWHYKENGKYLPIDNLREQVRAHLHNA